MQVHENNINEWDNGSSLQSCITLLMNFNYAEESCISYFVSTSYWEGGLASPCIFKMKIIEFLQIVTF